MDDDGFLALANEFWNSGSTIIHGNRVYRPRPSQDNNSALRRWISFFGISHFGCSYLWFLMIERIPTAGCQPKHLLFSLMFLRNYNKEHLNASCAGCDEKTFRKFCWLFALA
jgi:hypothetical protein